MTATGNQASTTLRTMYPGHTSYLQASRSQNEQSREQLLHRYMYLVSATRVRVAPNLPSRIHVEDLEQEGVIALLKLIDRYDRRRETKFETFAISNIRGALQEYLRKEDPVPRSVRNKQKQLRSAHQELSTQIGEHNVTDERLATYLGLTLDALFDLQKDSSPRLYLSLEDTVRAENGENDDIELQDTFVSDAPSVMDIALEGVRTDLLKKCLKWLPTNERIVLYHHFFGGLSLKDIATTILHKSPSWGSVLYCQGIRRLQGYLRREDTSWQH